MTAGSPASAPANARRGLVLWGVVAALGGVVAFVLPPLLLMPDEPEKAYGHPLIPWLALAFANIRYVPSVVAFLALGIVLGAAQPTRRLLMFCLAGTLLCVLHAINIAGDVRVDPTDHNLLPFEFVMIGALVLPALPGVFVGGAIRRLFDSHAS